LERKVWVGEDPVGHGGRGDAGARGETGRKGGRVCSGGGWEDSADGWMNGRMNAFEQGALRSLWPPRLCSVFALFPLKRCPDMIQSESRRLNAEHGAA
jgi:hypothetical protein